MEQPPTFEVEGPRIEQELVRETFDKEIGALRASGEDRDDAAARRSAGRRSSPSRRRHRAARGRVRDPGAVAGKGLEEIPWAQFLRSRRRRIRRCRPSPASPSPPPRPASSTRTAPTCSSPSSTRGPRWRASSPGRNAARRRSTGAPPRCPRARRGRFSSTPATPTPSPANAAARRCGSPPRWWPRRSAAGRSTSTSPRPG